MGNNDKFEDDLIGTKCLVDDCMGSKWEIGDKKLNIYLFCDKSQYEEYLERHFPKSPSDWATFDRKTNSILECQAIPKDKEDVNIRRAKMFAGIGHEMAHMHPFFGGVGNAASKGKWEQEMVCVFIEDKIRAQMGDEGVQARNLENAKKEFKKFGEEKKEFSWEKTDVDWETFYSAERLVYPWLEGKYGFKKLRSLWQQLFREKKSLPEAITCVFGETIGDLENNFKKDILKAKDYNDIGT